jgi:hypothetical protein
VVKDTISPQREKKKGEKEKKIKENKINFFVKLSVLKL